MAVNRNTFRPLPSQGELQRLLRYDPKTGALFWLPRLPSQFEDGVHSAEHSARKWNARYAGCEALTTTGPDRHRKGAIHGRVYMAHRVIWKMVLGADPDEIDHIDGDPSNNRWANLRDVSRAENARNMARQPKNTTGVSGVHWSTHRNKWCATGRLDNKTVNLGRYDRLQDAVEAREIWAREHGFHPNHGRDNWRCAQ